MDIEALVEWQPSENSLSGIGAGSAPSHWLAVTPIGIKDYTAAKWSAMVLEGCGSNVPAIMGLQPMRDLGGVVDLQNFSFEIDGPAGRQPLECSVISGHMILPVDWGGSALTLTEHCKQQFVSDPLGITVWFNETTAPVTSEVEPIPQPIGTSPSTLPVLPVLPEEGHKSNTLFFP
jgi:hypothetical protein